MNKMQKDEKSTAKVQTDEFCLFCTCTTLGHGGFHLHGKKLYWIFLGFKIFIHGLKGHFCFSALLHLFVFCLNLVEN